jgi:N-acetylmuramoyl-L-alanine amidase
LANVTRLILPLLVLSAVACSSAPRSPEPDRGGEPTVREVSVAELARRHGLEVVSSSSRGAVLRNGSNTVSIFPDPRGRAFVNGNPVGRTGGVVAHEGVLFVPVALENSIVASLAPPAAPEPARPSPVDEPRPTTPRAFLGRVVVDAGHGGRDTGTDIARHIMLEKTVTLDTALRLERLLRQGGVQVLMTRRKDVTVDLDARPAFTNRQRPDAFVSIHADSAENRSAHGFTLYIARRASSDSLALANHIHAELARTGVYDRGIRRADFRVVKNARCSAVLVELGFMSNEQEARRLATSTHRERMAKAISRGVLAYLNRP